MFLLKLPNQTRLMDCGETLFVGQSEEDCMKAYDILTWLATLEEPFQIMKLCGKLDSNGDYCSLEEIFHSSGLTDSRLEKLFQNIRNLGLSSSKEFLESLPPEFRCS